MPFPRLTYDEAMARYGTDKPDLRFGLELHDLTELARQSGFRVFASAVAAGGRVKGIVRAGRRRATAARSSTSWPSSAQALRAPRA